jgi:multidrug efflux pump subunit AcrA (membrane-fusion protein)
MVNPTRRRRTRGRTRNVVIAGAAGLAVVAVGGTAYAMSHRTTVAYRTAAVARGPVTQSLLLTGTVAPAVQSTVSFPVSGTVARVDVQTSSSVTAGQALASLDTTALQNQVTADNATVAAAKLTLYQAQTGQASTVAGGQSGANSSQGTAGNSSAGGSSNSSGGSTGGSTKGSTGSSGSNSAALRKAQQRLLATQRQVDAALARTRKDLAIADQACMAGPPGPTSSPSPSPTPTLTPTSTPHPSPSGSSSGGGACAAAEHSVLVDESATFKLQQSLAQQESSLNRLLATAATTSTSSSNGASSRTTPSASTSSTVVSAQQLVADQAAVDAAEAQLAVALQNLAQATIVSPISGTVASVGFTVGQQVSAGSTSSVIVVIGGNGHVVTTTVDVTKIATVKVGEHATISADGSAAVHTGTVLALGVAPATSGSTAYPVTIGVTDAGAGLRNGATATVQLITGQATSTLTVPTSAIRALGGFHYVTVLRNGQTTSVRVTVGAIGPLNTQVAGQLSVGDQVVLADLNQPLPASNTTTRLGGAGGLGGLGGAGGGGFRARQLTGGGG